ncbi:glycogen debranching protein [Aureitalea sp. L0-47]|uniref:alpha-L-rhamnosidase-related protein n=1 Tax=Aureitalea sp. L0-47 TaxID=2816962 RepID=UPI00223913A0|nr:glycogen debranching protein [Aureitalea sp. L0-47]MCW5521022.1 glycogen debranching protein [Aureitalea sp. L0-47]
MKKQLLVFGAILLIAASCNKEEKQLSIAEILKDSPSIEGKKEYLASPYVTAGDRVYMVGQQDGSFPELGWHIQGEMSGIWNHPIKLMDGFEIDIMVDSTLTRLNKASKFTNFPYANQHEFDLKEIGLSATRSQFVPDGKQGLVVQVAITNSESTAKDLKISYRANVDLRPTWLGERTEMNDESDTGTYNAIEETMTFKDGGNPWYVKFGADVKATTEAFMAPNYKGKGQGGLLNYELPLGANETKTISFFIAGSYQSENDLNATYKQISSNYGRMIRAKKERYEGLARQTKLTVPDKEIEQAFEWVKYNCDWLVRSVPEVGTGIGAGIPDYPWWFGVDSEYALQGYMAIGQRDAVYNTIKLLDSVSEAVNGNGRIIHEMSTNGAVFNPGNINETPQYATLIWKIYQWNGDKEFLQKYFPTIKKGLNWLMTEKDADGNLFPDGFGMMEIHGLDSEMIDVAAYTQKAFKDASYIADALGDYKLAQEYFEKAEAIQKKINEEFWSEEFRSYADFIGTDEQALHLIEDAIVRADTLGKPWAVEELKQTREAIKKNPSSTARPFVLHHNWVVNTPMEVGLATDDKAQLALVTAEKYVNPFGVFVTGIDRDESAGSDDGSFKGSKIFSYTGAVMTLPTGVQIVSENNYGRPDKALNYLKRMTRSFSYALPGSIYEVSPDYGMMTQAWNVYSYAVPIVEQFFGIRPDAANKKVVIEPKLPSTWKVAALENVPIGDNEVSVFISEGKIKLIQTKNDWLVELRLPMTEDSQINPILGEVDITEDSEAGVYIVKSVNAMIEVNYNN